MPGQQRNRYGVLRCSGQSLSARCLESTEALPRRAEPLTSTWQSKGLFFGNQQDIVRPPSSPLGEIFSVSDGEMGFIGWLPASGWDPQESRESPLRV